MHKPTNKCFEKVKFLFLGTMDEKGLPFFKIWHIAIFDPRSNSGHYGRWLINYVGHKIIEQHVASSWKDSEDR